MFTSNERTVRVNSEREKRIEINGLLIERDAAAALPSSENPPSSPAVPWSASSFMSARIAGPRLGLPQEPLLVVPSQELLRGPFVGVDGNRYKHAAVVLVVLLAVLELLANALADLDPELLGDRDVAGVE